MPVQSAIIVYYTVRLDIKIRTDYRDLTRVYDLVNEKSTLQLNVFAYAINYTLKMSHFITICLYSLEISAVVL